MDKKEIVQSLKKIFSKYFNIDEEFKEENFDKALTGFFSFDYSDLVYLYILIEEIFNITIDGRQLREYRFNIVNGIVEAIMESMPI